MVGDELRIRKTCSGRRMISNRLGETLGEISLDNLELDNSEFQNIAQGRETRKAMSSRAQVRLTELAKSRARDQGLSFREAMTEIGRENPQLCAEARQEALRTR